MWLFYLHCNINPTKSMRPKLWPRLGFSQQDKNPRPFRLFQFRDQRTDAGVFFDGIYKHITMSLNIQSPVSLTTADTKQMRAVSLLRVASFMQHSSTPVFPQCLDPWLGYPLREGFPPPLYSHRVSQHMADQLRESISSSSQAPNPHFGDLFGFF